MCHSIRTHCFMICLTGGTQHILEFIIFANLVQAMPPVALSASSAQTPEGASWSQLGQNHGALSPLKDKANGAVNLELVVHNNEQHTSARLSGPSRIVVLMGLVVAIAFSVCCCCRVCGCWGRKEDPDELMSSPSFLKHQRSSARENASVPVPQEEKTDRQAHSSAHSAQQDGVWITSSARHGEC